LHNFKEHLPDEWHNKIAKIERKFFWAILISLASEFVEALIKDCRE